MRNADAQATPRLTSPPAEQVALNGFYSNLSYMATYTICPRLDRRGYDIRIVGINGSRQTMLGFKTEAEAEAWIDGDIWLDVGWALTLSRLP